MNGEGLTAEELDDGPECETCGKTDCPDADLPAFSEPRRCTYKPIYDALRDARNCDYGCARDYTNQSVRFEVVAAVERILAARASDGLADKVRTLHEYDEAIPGCSACRHRWPCPTIALLDEDDQ